MMVIEMRKAAQDKTFELVDEIKDLDRKKKMVFCELEEMLYECFDSMKDEEEEDDYNPGEEEMDYRRSYRYGRRHGMRHDDEDEMYNTRRSMRMRRRDRMGRFV